VKISHEHSDYNWVKVEDFKKIVFKEIVEDLDKYGALNIKELK
jgi:hypothetical protein